MSTTCGMWPDPSIQRRHKGCAHAASHGAGPGYYALYCEDPDRIKVELVAPHET